MFARVFYRLFKQQMESRSHSLAGRRSLRVEQLESRCLLAGESISAADFNPYDVDITGHESLLPKLGRQLTAMFAARDRITNNLPTNRVPAPDWMSPRQLTDSEVRLYAFASGDTDRLMNDLKSLSFRRAVTRENVIAAWAPLEALDELATLAGLRFAGSAYREDVDAVQGRAA